MTPAGCHCADLPDASVVITRALLTARQNITDTVTARAMMCIDGGAGVGRTLAVNARLHEREPHEYVRTITFRARPTDRAVCHERLTALDMAGEPPRHPSEFDCLLQTAVAERPRTFLVDEANGSTGRRSSASATCGTNPPPSWGTLGFRLVAAEHGRAVFGGDPAEHLLNPMGTVRELGRPACLDRA
ncbi:hypothetical protein [Streptomyces sp. Tue6028]|uniref:hypothetical protein n=1 Tax=Streptomyces sp. Tue6028 TaxID=2036037 RepID=UPI003D715C71